METAEKQFGSLDDFEQKVMGSEYTPPAEQEERPQENTDGVPPVEEQPPSSEETTEQAEEQGEEIQSSENEDVPKEETPTETVFDINEINKRFGTNFTDEDSLKSALSSQQTEELQGKLTELETQIQELEAVKEENVMLRESLDPMKYFASEDDYKIAQFKKQFPDKDAATAYQLFSEDLSKFSDKDVLAYEMMLDNPGLDKATVMEVVNDKYGIEDGEELDRVQMAKIKVDANKARKNMGALKSQINLPDKVDVDALSNQQKELREQKAQRLSEGWRNVGNEIAKTLDDIVVKDTIDGKDVELFRYSIDKDFPGDVVESVANIMSQTGVEVSKEAAQSAAEVFKEKYLARNIDKILKAAVDHVKAKAEEERLNKQHNPGTGKPEAKAQSNAEDYDSKILAGLNKGWQPSKPFG